MNKTKQIPNEIPHGIARVQVSEPLRACVGPQERPKGESSQGPVISNEERNPILSGLCTFPTKDLNSGWERFLVARLCRDDSRTTIGDIRAGTPRRPTYAAKLRISTSARFFTASSAIERTCLVVFSSR